MPIGISIGIPSVGNAQPQALNKTNLIAQYRADLMSSTSSIPNQQGTAPALSAVVSTGASLVAGGQNGRQVLRFTSGVGAGPSYQCALGALAAPFTVIVARKFNNLLQPSGDFDYVWQIGKATASGCVSSSRWNAGDANAQKYYCYDGNAANFGPVITGQLAEVVTAIHTTTAPRHNLWINGVAQTVSDYAASISTTGQLTLGAFANSSGAIGGNWFNGDFYEMLLFNTALASSDRVSWEADIDSRWNCY